MTKILLYLTYTFNNIVTYSRYPDVWKISKIIPVPKTNGEYRPIAIVPFLSKVFEVLLNRQIKDHLEKHELITERQSGYRAQHSCTTALINVVDEIREHLDNNEIAFLVQ